MACQRRAAGLPAVVGRSCPAKRLRHRARPASVPTGRRPRACPGHAALRIEQRKRVPEPARFGQHAQGGRRLVAFEILRRVPVAQSFARHVLHERRSAAHGRHVCALDREPELAGQRAARIRRSESSSKRLSGSPTARAPSPRGRRVRLSGPANARFLCARGAAPGYGIDREIAARQILVDVVRDGHQSGRRWSAYWWSRRNVVASTRRWSPCQTCFRSDPPGTAPASCPGGRRVATCQSNSVLSEHNRGAPPPTT